MQNLLKPIPAHITNEAHTHTLTKYTEQPTTRLVRRENRMYRKKKKSSAEEKVSQ